MIDGNVLNESKLNIPRCESVHPQAYILTKTLVDHFKIENYLNTNLENI